MVVLVGLSCGIESSQAGRVTQGHHAAVPLQLLMVPCSSSVTSIRLIAPLGWGDDCSSAAAKQKCASTHDCVRHLIGF